MLITAITSTTPNRSRYAVFDKKNAPQTNAVEYNESTINLSQIAFGSIYGIKPKKINIDAEKAKLLRQINELLEADTEDTSFEDILAKAFSDALRNVRNRIMKEQELEQRYETIIADKSLNEQQRFESLLQLQKEAKRIQKNKQPYGQQQVKKTADERIDYTLLNRFKSAINNDDFNLEKVFQDYYKGLEDITSLQELHERYPKIKIPQHPVEVISKKMADTITRDFYEKFDDIVAENQPGKLVEHVIPKLKTLCDTHAQAYGIDKNEFTDKIAQNLYLNIKEQYTKALKEDKFSSIPEHRKNKLAQITPNDKQLLGINFEDFVLSVIKKHYLEGQKLSEIKYSDGNTEIPLSSIKDSNYKIEKFPEKIKKFISTAKQIFAAQRDYENFDNTQLKKRLDLYSNSKIADNEIILERIIDFDSCMFEKEDITALKGFLRVLDDISDGKITIHEGLDIIRQDKLVPKGTEKLNEIEKQKAAARIKVEQQKAFRLNEIKSGFDDAINILYINNMNNIATTCTKYRPENLDTQTLENAEFIIKLINQNVNPSDLRITDKTKLETGIMRWDTYNMYKDTDADAQVFQKALQTAKSDDGSIYIDKAGKYLINSEIVTTYPESLEFVKNREILEKVMAKSPDKETAIQYLMKFDEYQDLPDEKKSHLTQFINIFDSKDSIEKAMLKYIIENEYILRDTEIMTKIIDNGTDSPITATFGAQAKQQIVEKYKFPGSLSFLEGFEEAIAAAANSGGSSGIKQTGRNNEALLYKMEVKRGGHDDRLFSSKNDYYFDIFSEKGLH